MSTPALSRLRRASDNAILAERLTPPFTPLTWAGAESEVDIYAEVIDTDGVAHRSPNYRTPLVMLSTAEAAWKASKYTGGAFLTDLTGRGHHARLGSTEGADSNDPLWLPRNGQNYVYLPGTAGNSLVRQSDGFTLTAQGNHLMGCTGAEPWGQVTDAQGDRWTVNRSASGRKTTVVDRPLFLLGTDDYLEVPDHPALNFGAGESFTLLIAARIYGSTSTDAFLIGKRRNNDATLSLPGYVIRHGAVNRLVRVCDSTSIATAVYPALTDGAASVIGMVVDGAAGTLRSALGGALSAPVASVTGDLGNDFPLTIGRAGTNAQHADMAFIGAALFRRALSTTEIARAGQDLLL